MRAIHTPNFSLAPLTVAMATLKNCQKTAFFKVWPYRIFIIGRTGMGIAPLENSGLYLLVMESSNRR